MPPIRLSRGTLISLGVLVIIGELVGLCGYHLTKLSDPELAKILAGGAITLFFGALLGGVVKVLLEDLDLQRANRAADAEFLNNVLADLKDVYDRVERAKTLIAAHRSAKTYGDEMRDLIDSRVKLLNVLRAIKKDPRAYLRMSAIESEVDSMEKYLGQIVTEFQRQYKAKADLQRVHEAKINRALGKATDADDANANELLKNNDPWQKIAEVDAVNDWLSLEGTPAAPGTASRKTYKSDFVEKLDSASEKLREKLKSLLS